MNPTSPTLYLAWQDPESRQWFPIGRLRITPEGRYRFVYTEGFRQAEAQAGLHPIVGFPEVNEIYESTELFPLFSNRVMSPARAEYASYLERLDISNDVEAPMFILARSEGRRSTDSFEVFPYPLADGAFRIHFFVHGVRHTPEAAQLRAASLVRGERLLVVPDPQNPQDPKAVALRTEDKHLLGYLPRYYSADVLRLLAQSDSVNVVVERVNPPPVPAQQRVMASLHARWDEATPPFEDRVYRPIPEDEAP